MKPYHLLWAWALKNVMQREPCKWAIKMLEVLLIFWLRKRQREHRNGRRIWGEKRISCGCGDLLKINSGLFVIVLSVFLISPNVLQGAKKVWNDTLKESGGSQDVEWIGLHWVSMPTSITFRAQGLGLETLSVVLHHSLYLLFLNSVTFE